MKKRVLSLFLAFVMALSLLPVGAFATDDHAVTVGFTVVDCIDGEIEYMREELTVKPGLAAEYLGATYGDSGFTNVEVGADDVTPIDVMVAAHIKKYGDTFTPNNAASYVGNYSYLSTMFGEMSEITWTANGLMPVQDDGMNGCGVNQYTVTSGDEISFYRMSFSSYPSSVYASFDKTESAISVGEELTLKLGFCALMDYTSTPYPAAGAALHYLNEDGSVEGETEWTTDENGNVTVFFDAAGTYYLTAKGTVTYEAWGSTTEGVLSPAYCKVTVTAGTEEPPSEPGPATYTVTLPNGDGYTVTAKEGSPSPVTEGGSYSFTVTMAEGYEAGENFTVKANGTVLTAVDGVYTIENITTDQTVVVSGVVKKEEATAPTWQEAMTKTQAYLFA